MSVTASLQLDSPSITNDVLKVSLKFNLRTEAGDPVSQLVGISRTAVPDTRLTLFASASYAEGGIVYIKNLESDYSNKLLIEMGTGVNAIEVGYVYGGECFLMPWNGEEEFSVTSDDTSTNIEYAIFVK